MYFDDVVSKEQVNSFAPLVEPVTLIVNSPNGFVVNVSDVTINAEFEVTSKFKDSVVYPPLGLNAATVMSP